MPKIRFDKQRPMNDEHPQNDCMRRGLRSSQHRNDPHCETVRDIDFDMYRIDFDAKRKGQKRRKPVGNKMKNDHEIRLWHIACLISALGVFCIFVDAVRVEVGGIPISLTSLSVLTGSIDPSVTIPQYATFLSAVPLMFLSMFILFAYLRNDVFNKASLAIIAMSIATMAVTIHWSGQIMDCNLGYMTRLYPGNGILIEIGCSIALVIVAVCGKLMNSPLPSLPVRR